jgi:2,4-dienoyl-CoA reductase-like NADH-dependent reductase (Old Yellow Enzyme family)
MKLFDSFPIRGVTMRNRVGVSPMCQYSAENGVPGEWHLVHLGSRAVGGAGLVVAEATAIEAIGRISPGDTGIYSDAQAEAWAKIARFIMEQGAVPGIQLAHAGRKASNAAPWTGRGPLSPEDGGWTGIVAPSPIPFTEGWQVPIALDCEGISSIVKGFMKAASRSLDAGFELIELHGAHGYLINEFLSPLSNRRTDGYGGSFENRTKIAREIVSAVREVWPERLPLLVRISATDYTEGGWDLDQSVELAKMLHPLGADMIDVSSGGNVSGASIPVAPGYQAPFAAEIRAKSGVPTAAVGLITDSAQAEEIVSSGKADIVFLARELLRDPYWPRRAAAELGEKIPAPNQYARAW